MAAPVERKTLQIHLSTTIVLMFVAGVFMWLNLTPGDPINPESGIDLPASNFGWPLKVYSVTPFDYDINFRYAPIVADFIIALICLMLVTRFCEWVIRQRI